MQIGSEMAALQEKTPKMDPKKRFFWKIPQDFELLKKVPQNIHQTGQFGWNRYIGIWNLSHGAFQGSVGRKMMDLGWLLALNGNIADLENEEEDRDYDETGDHEDDDVKDEEG